LKREGVVEAKWYQEGDTRPRKYYRLTTQGEEKLSSMTERWRKSVEDIEVLLNNPGPKSIMTKGEQSV
jgi:PadR family transcriptional regulator PadR